MLTENVILLLSLQNASEATIDLDLEVKFNYPVAPFHFTICTVIMIMIHMFVIGVPISFLANKYYTRT